MNPLLFTIIFVGWLFVSLYTVVSGVLMITSPRYRKHISRLWFRSDHDVDGLMVRFLGGPLFMLIGLLFAIYGIWALDLSYGILSHLPTLRATINFFTQ